MHLLSFFLSTLSHTSQYNNLKFLSQDDKDVTFAALIHRNSSQMNWSIDGHVASFVRLREKAHGALSSHSVSVSSPQWRKLDKTTAHNLNRTVVQMTGASELRAAASKAFIASRDATEAGFDDVSSGDPEVQYAVQTSMSISAGRLPQPMRLPKPLALAVDL